MISRVQLRWDVPQRLPREGDRAQIATLLIQGVGQLDRPTVMTLDLAQQDGRWVILHDGELLEGFEGYDDPMQAVYEAFGAFCEVTLPEAAKMLTRELAKKAGYEEAKS